MLPMHQFQKPLIKFTLKGFHGGITSAIAWTDKIAYKRARAIAQFSKNKIRSESWDQYVSRINRNTPMSQIWDRIRKMKGMYKQHHTPTLNIQGRLITDSGEVANNLAHHYETVSGHNNYNGDFLHIKPQLERQVLNLTQMKSCHIIVL